MLNQGNRVRHKKDRTLGIGQIGFMQPQGTVTTFYVSWPSKPGSLQAHTEFELEPVLDMVDRLAPQSVGRATFDPFVLRLLGRWFESRHALTGELSNQPFQMLPHQVIVTNRVVNSAPDQRRWLVADDVGLGKTIEAGMIMEVLRKRTLGRLGRFRCLVLAPAGLRKQWQEEMERRFNRQFRLFESSSTNELEASDLLIASIDTLKSKKLDAALQSVTPWDLVIFDEAHHLATETHIQKYDLAKRLHERKLAQNTLFLTATPHSGNVEHFYNMLRLLRPDLFKSKEDVSQGDGRLNQVMLRNRKSEVTDASGERIFKGIHPARILTCTPTAQEVAFYEELLSFVKKGYGDAELLKTNGKETSNGNAVGFLMATFRKLASSSRAAIESALKRRLRALQEAEPIEPVQGQEDERFQGEQAERDVAKLALHKAVRGKGKLNSPIQNERESIQKLLDILAGIDHPDSKLTFFVQELKKLPADEKALIFTEYRGSQDALFEALEESFGEGQVGIVHGSLTLEQRQDTVRAFNSLPQPRFLVSTEAGGEGLNMQQSCHIVFNYDLPWNPVRLQQRIGRVYRYGQAKEVQVYNIRLESESEAFADARIDAYLRIKLTEIAKRLAEVQGGKAEDIENDVLGQVVQSMSLDELYQQAVTEGEERAKQTINERSEQLRQILENPEGTLGLFKGLRAFDMTDYQKAAARVSDATLDFFVRKYLGRQGESVQPRRDGVVAFHVPQLVKDVAARVQKADPYESHRKIEENRVEQATVSRQVARTVPGTRLLRFGDPVFDAMVRHVQDSDFSEGVASIQLPADAIGWATGQKGVLAVFDLKVLRQDASLGGAHVLRDELSSFVVPFGSTPAEADHILEGMCDALPGDLTIDLAEARRGYDAAKQAADGKLTQLYQACVEEFGTAEAVLKQADDFALAWVEAI
jgi:superfamily II DNA or RNA helicase